MKRKSSQVYDFRKVWTFFESEYFIFFSWQFNFADGSFAGCNITDGIKLREI